MYTHWDLRELEGDQFHLGNVQTFLAAFFSIYVCAFRKSSAEKFSASRNSHGDWPQFTSFTGGRGNPLTKQRLKILLQRRSCSSYKKYLISHICSVSQAQSQDPLSSWRPAPAQPSPSATCVCPSSSAKPTPTLAPAPAATPAFTSTPTPNGESPKFPP